MAGLNCWAGYTTGMCEMENMAKKFSLNFQEGNLQTDFPDLSLISFHRILWTV